MGVLNIKFNGTDIVIDAKTDIIVNDKFIDEVATKDGFLCKANFNKKSVKIDLVLKAKLLLIPITRKTTIELKDLEIENDYEIIIEYDNFNGKFSSQFSLITINKNVKNTKTINKKVENKKTKKATKKDKEINLVKICDYWNSLSNDDIDNLYDRSEFIFESIDSFFKNKEKSGKSIEYMTGFVKDPGKFKADTVFRTDSSFYIDYNKKDSSGLYNIRIVLLVKNIRSAVQERFIGDKEWQFESATKIYFYPFYNVNYYKEPYWSFSFDDNGISSDKEFNNIIKSKNTFLQKKEIQIINEFLLHLQNTLKDSLSKVETVLSNRDELFHELDLDGNGIIDVAEGNDDIIKLVRKFQSEKVKIDDTHMDGFIKISKYIKDRKSNLQYIFESCKEEKNANWVNEYIGIIKNEINTINSLLMHTISMIVSLKENDKVTFYEIYQTFENLNIFDSKWQKDVSEKLSDISNGLNSLMNSVNDMNTSISNELKNLTYTTDENFKSLNKSITSHLKGINSSIKFNNLLTTINTYQSYRINKKLV